MNTKAESLDPKASVKMDIEDHVQMIVQYKTDDECGGLDDLEKRHFVEQLLNECLGWTGNGHCDGGDIGSGTINAYSFVVDPQLAKDAAINALQANELLDGAIIAVNEDERYKVLWPKDFEGEFSIM